MLYMLLVGLFMQIFMMSLYLRCSGTQNECARCYALVSTQPTHPFALFPGVELLLPGSRHWSWELGSFHHLPQGGARVRLEVGGSRLSAFFLVCCLFLVLLPVSVSIPKAMVLHPEVRSLSQSSVFPTLSTSMWLSPETPALTAAQASESCSAAFLL